MELRRGRLQRGLQGAVCASVFLLACGCGEPCGLSCGSIVTDIGGRAWSGPAILTLRNDDTLSLRDIVLFMRCDSRFCDDTLTLRVELFTPDSLHLSEPFLFSPSGHRQSAPRLFDRGCSSTGRSSAPGPLDREISGLYRRRARLGRAGDYRFVITPSRPVEGIEAAGIHFEPSK